MGKLKHIAKQTGQAISSQIQKVTRAERPRCLPTGKTGAGPCPQVAFSPLACCWSCGLDSLTFPPWRWYLSLCCVSAPGPEKQQNQQVMPGAAAMTDDPPTLCSPISGNPSPEKTHLEKLVHILLKSPLKYWSLKIRLNPSRQRSQCCPPWGTPTGISFLSDFSFS